MQTPEKPHIEKMPDGLGRGEIIAIVLAMLLPVGVLALLLVPGAFDAFVRFMLTGSNAVIVCGIGAVIVAMVLGFRIWIRMQRRKRRAAGGGSASFWDFWRDPYR